MYTGVEALAESEACGELFGRSERTDTEDQDLCDDLGWETVQQRGAVLGFVIVLCVCGWESANEFSEVKSNECFSHCVL